MANIARDDVRCPDGETTCAKGLLLKNSRGFTLVELLIGIAVLATIAGIAVPGYFKMIKNARVARACGDITSMAAAISIYRFQIPRALEWIETSTRLIPTSISTAQGKMAAPLFRLQPRRVAMTSSAPTTAAT
jgi:prepilin-type N-terminal cleavage/methylation domain-containing protein